MNKISERLKAYQTQMSIYAEQHKVILASDVLDMIEQLQDDLKDSIDKVVEELDEYLIKLVGRGSALYQTVMHIVKKGGVDNAT